MSKEFQQMSEDELLEAAETQRRAAKRISELVNSENWSTYAGALAETIAVNRQDMVRQFSAPSGSLGDVFKAEFVKGICAGLQRALQCPQDLIEMYETNLKLIEGHLESMEDGRDTSSTDK